MTHHDDPSPPCTCPPGWPMPLHIRCPVGHESDVERHYSRCACYDPRLHSYAVWCPVPDCLGNAQVRRAMRQPAGVIGQSCAWCDQLNAFTVTRCATGGHDAHRPRRQCGCPTCQARRSGPPS